MPVPSGSGHPDERAKIALPGTEELVHVEDVVRRDGRTPGEAIGLGSGGLVRDEAEPRAATRGAVHLEEEQVVTPRQEPETVDGDALLADGAADAVEKRAKVILGTHPSGSVAGRSHDGAREGLPRIPPGGMIAVARPVA